MIYKNILDYLIVATARQASTSPRRQIRKLEYEFSFPYRSWFNGMEKRKKRRREHRRKPCFLPPFAKRRISFAAEPNSRSSKALISLRAVSTLSVIIKMFTVVLRSSVSRVSTCTTRQIHIPSHIADLYHLKLYIPTYH